MNRYLCSVLEEMRDVLKIQTRFNMRKCISIQQSLIEEVQVLANRMEAAISDKKDIRWYSEKRSKLRKEVRELKAEVKGLKALLPEEEEEVDENLRDATEHMGFQWGDDDE